MSVSKVYFTDMRCKVGTSLLEKLDKLMIAAGIGEIDFENKFVAIKLHFGEPGNLSFLRPNFAKAVADRVKAPWRQAFSHGLQYAVCRAAQGCAGTHDCRQ